MHWEIFYVKDWKLDLGSEYVVQWIIQVSDKTGLTVHEDTERLPV